MFMFTETLQKYYYGEGTDHVVMLSEAEANAVNKIRLYEVGENLFKTNLSRSEMKHYHKASAKLNDYLDATSTPVMCSDEYLETNNILRPV